MPTTPFPAPRKGLSLATLEPLRARITCLAAPGGLTGGAQEGVPGGHVDGLAAGGARPAPRPEHVPGRPRRPDRRAAGELARGPGRRAAGRAVYRGCAG